MVDVQDESEGFLDNSPSRVELPFVCNMVTSVQTFYDGLTFRSDGDF